MNGGPVGIKTSRARPQERGGRARQSAHPQVSVWLLRRSDCSNRSTTSCSHAVNFWGPCAATQAIEEQREEKKKGVRPSPSLVQEAKGKISHGLCRAEREPKGVLLAQGGESHGKEKYRTVGGTLTPKSRRIMCKGGSITCVFSRGGWGVGDNKCPL